MLKKKIAVKQINKTGISSRKNTTRSAAGILLYQKCRKAR